MDKKIRYGIIGFGAQGSSYVNILTGTPAFPGFPAAAIPAHTELGAICDNDPAKREAAAAKFPNIPIYADYKEMIASGNVDAVITTVPHYLHHEMAIYAMEHGMHVIGEKPAGVRASDVQKMLDCAAAHPEVKLGIMFNQRTNKLYQKIREIVASGELGEIRRSNWIINTWWRPDSYYAQSAWRATWGGEGGGVLVNQAPHQLDLWQWICGLPVKVQSHLHYGKWHDIEVEDDVTTYVEYENGATGVFVTTTGDGRGTNRFEIQMDGAKLIVENDKLYLDEFSVSEPEFSATNKVPFISIPSTFSEVETDGLNPQHGGVMNAWAGAILRGEPLVADGREGIRGLTLSNAMHLSSFTGQAVTLPIDEDLFYEELKKRIATSRRKEVTESVVSDLSNTYGGAK